MRSMSTQGDARNADSGRRITLADQIPGRWIGGTTRGIYTYPPSAQLSTADFWVWLGTATIERDADYSYFPNVHRLHMPMTGNGIHLHFRDPEEMNELATFEQASFDGSRPLHARLVDGPISAFNLIFRHNVQATATPLTLTQHDLAFPLNTAAGASSATGESSLGALRTVLAVYAVAGSLALHTSHTEETMLDSGDAFVVQNATVDVLTLRSTGEQATCIVAEISVREFQSTG